MGEEYQRKFRKDNWQEQGDVSLKGKAENCPKLLPINGKEKRQVGMKDISIKGIGIDQSCIINIM
eukprot:snap_masked-scaffold_3-processed-gene-21.30-mRNA-1 protein AED:1.00 eAED:1.00 QI:0/0/0/0/1/1/2/0/64